MNEKQFDHEYCMMPLDLEVSPALVNDENLLQTTTHRADCSLANSHDNNEMDTVNERYPEKSLSLNLELSPDIEADPVTGVEMETDIADPLLGEQSVMDQPCLIDNAVAANDIADSVNFKEAYVDIAPKVMHNIIDGPVDDMQKSHDTNLAVIKRIQETIPNTQQERIDKDSQKAVESEVKETDIDNTESENLDNSSSANKQSTPEKLAQLKRSILRGLRMNIPLASSPNLTVVTVKVRHRKQHVYAPILRIPNDDDTVTEMVQSTVAQLKARKRPWKEGKYKTKHF